MKSTADPIVGEWYHYPEKSQKFKVVAIDNNTDTVEIQYFDGDIGEFDFSAWYGLGMQRIEAPEDWTGPMDNIENDDLNSVGTEMRREDWAAPYDEELEKRHAEPRDLEENEE